MPTTICEIVENLYGFRPKEIKPCPLCGNDITYAGHTDALSMGLICYSCNLELREPFPEMLEVVSNVQDAIKNVEVKTLKIAIKKWNRRTTKSQ